MLYVLIILRVAYALRIYDSYDIVASFPYGSVEPGAYAAWFFFFFFKI